MPQLWYRWFTSGSRTISSFLQPTFIDSQCLCWKATHYVVFCICVLGKDKIRITFQLIDLCSKQNQAASSPRGERIQSVLQRIVLGIMHTMGNTSNMGNVGWGWDWALGKKDKIVCDQSCPIKRSSDDHRESFNLTDLIR